MERLEEKQKLKFAYYPGCTLKTNASNFEIPAMKVAEKLGIEMEEINDWTCCGTMYSLASDDKMKQIAPIRNIMRAQTMGHTDIIALCSMCYNTLESSNQLVQIDTDMKDTLNLFMDDEKNYDGLMTVHHFLEVLRDEITWDEVKKEIINPLNGMKLASYYGCALTRPSEVAIDDTEQPFILEDLFLVIGAEPISYPYSVECCGSYNVVNYREAVIDRTYNIITSARNNGAEAIVLSCPLCDFNLDQIQKETSLKYRDFNPMPIFYFSQILALSMGVSIQDCGFDRNYTDPSPLLEKYKLIEEPISRTLLK